MILETERLELILLTPRQLKLWIDNINALENELNCLYKADPMDGFFREIVTEQYEIAIKDENNYPWHSFFLLVRKEDRVVVGSADFKDIPNEHGEVEIGYGLGEKFEHHGYMREAVKAICKWTLEQDNISSIIAETYTDGFGSQNILKHCGFTKYKEGVTIWWRLSK